jgi:CysZ protein
MAVEAARALRKRSAPAVFLAGLLPAALTLIPIVNLVVPLFATSFFTHLFKSVRLSSS